MKLTVYGRKTVLAILSCAIWLSIAFLSGYGAFVGMLFGTVMLWLIDTISHATAGKGDYKAESWLALAFLYVFTIPIACVICIIVIGALMFEDKGR